MRQRIEAFRERGLLTGALGEQDGDYYFMDQASAKRFFTPTHDLGDKLVFDDDLGVWIWRMAK